MEEPDSAEAAVPVRPNPPGLFVGFVPSVIETGDIARPGGETPDRLHLTLRYYGSVSNAEFVDAAHQAARTVARNTPPFVAAVAGRRQLGNDTPPADVLVMNVHPAMTEARAALPPSDRDFPTYLPHVTVGWGLGDDEMAASTPDGDIMFDRIAVGVGDDWTFYTLGSSDPIDDIPLDDNPDDIEDIPLDDDTNDSVTAGLDDVIEGKIDAPGSKAKSRTVGKLDPRPGGKKQKCHHGSPATCKSVRWIAVYSALRDKGYPKSKAAAIANSMHRKWRMGIPNKPGQRPMVRKTI